MSDVRCPYCNCEQNICHDDGQGYAEDEQHEMQCSDCKKYFVFTTSISFHYEADKADCLNDGEHKLKMNSCYPRRYSQMHCQDCDYRRNPTPEEFAAAGIDLNEQLSTGG